MVVSLKTYPGWQHPPPPQQLPPIGQHLCEIVPRLSMLVIKRVFCLKKVNVITILTLANTTREGKKGKLKY